MRTPTQIRLLQQENARALLILLAARKVGAYLYSWGGEEADEGGFDCSGFVSQVLAEVARHFQDVYDGKRRTAAGIRQYYEKRGLPAVGPHKIEDLRPGMVVFYESSAGRTIHVALHAVTAPPLHHRLPDDGHLEMWRSSPVGPIAFEAGGSGSAATTPRAALLKAATVRMCATDRRSTWLAIDPVRLIS